MPTTFHSCWRTSKSIVASLIWLCVLTILSGCAQPTQSSSRQQVNTTTPLPSGTPINPELALLPTGTLPPTAAAFATMKAQDLTAEADYQATAQAMPTDDPAATWEPLTPMPRPTERLGIYQCGSPDAPRKNEVFGIINCWQGITNGFLTTLVAGVSLDDPPSASLRMGGIQVYTTTLDYTNEVRSDVYWTSAHVGWIEITSVQGTIATLTTENGSTLYFDYINHQWLINPNLTPVPATSTPTALPATSFPSTAILDRFNRADGALGADWTGATQNYSIAGNSLHAMGGDAQPLLWNSSFGASQEVFTTISTLDANASELDLVLKAQDTTPCNLLEVWYQPSRGTAQVWTCHNWGSWTQHGADMPMSLAAGDQFGARATADGTVTVYKNGTAVGSVTVDSSWPYVANGGRVGLWLIDAPNTVLDDVGGGTLP